MDKERQIYQQNKENNDKLVKAISEQKSFSININGEAVKAIEVKSPKGENGKPGINGKTPIKGVDYLTKSEVDDIIESIVSQIPVPKNGVDGINPVVDYESLRKFIKGEVSKIPKPKDGVDGKTPVIYYDSIIEEVLKKMPAFDYEPLNKYVEKRIEDLDRARPRLLNSAGPTTRLGEMSDIDKTTQANNSVLVWNGTDWEYMPYGGGGGSQDLQSVTDIGSTTTNNIDALSFNSVPLTNTGSSSKFLAEDGTYLPVPTAGVLTYMFSSVNSDIATYESMPSLSSYTIGALATKTTAGVSTTPTLLEVFATDIGFPNVTTIPIGLFTSHFETEKLAGSNNYYVYFEVYKRTSGGTETLLSTSDISCQFAVNTVIQHTLTAPSLTAIPLLSTDRIVIKIYGVMLSSTATIYLYYDDTTSARLELPSATVDATNFLPYSGATGDTNTGVHGITTNDLNISAQTASRAVVFDASKNLISSATTSTEIGYVSGVTSSIQTQLNGKQATGSYALTTGTLAQFASTTSSELRGVISDETGTGALVFGTSPTFTGNTTISAGDLLLGSTYAVKWTAGSQLYEQTVALSGVDRMIYQPNGSRFDVINSAGSQFIAQFQSSAIDLYTSGVARFNINSTGLVGIGVTPRALFHVGGSVDQVYTMYIGSEVSGYNGGNLTFVGAGAANVASIQGTYDTANLGKIEFGTYVSGMGTRMTLLGNNLGIGQTAPTAVLHLKAGTATANTGPLKLTAGTALTTPEAGVFEFSNSETGLTFTAVSTRRQVVLDTATQTVSGKRISKRVLALSANSATPAINTDLYDVVHITSQTAAITSFTSSLTGTPVDGDTLRISVTGTAAVALTFGSSFEASTVALPTTTVSTTRLDIGFFWNTETSKWRITAQA